MTTARSGVSFTTTNGSAAAGQDYTAAAGTLNWADGEDGVKTFNVAVANDGNDESNETVNLQLSSPTGARFSATRRTRP